MTRQLIVTAALLSVWAATPASAQWISYKAPGIPRTADGKPNLKAPAPQTADGNLDLSGLWRADPGGYGLNIASELKPSDIQPWARELFDRRSEEFGKDHPGFRCMPEIGPYATFGIFKLLQSPTTVAVLSGPGQYWQILTDGRPLPKDPNPTWMGYSVGRWDGRTFVVESAGFNDLTWLDFGGHPHTEALRVTTRFTRPDYGHLHIAITFDDPKAYARPWTITLDAELDPDTELIEYVCNENEKSIAHFVVTDEDRRKARTVVKVPPEVLASYVGDYELIDPAGKRQAFKVTLSGEQLIAQPPMGGSFPLTAESETVFNIAGARVEFFKDAQGTVSHFVVTTVEGSMKATRKGR